METTLITTLAVIFVFGLLVFVHELGHFITAKMTNMRVEEFAIGFGPKLLSFRKGETLYSLRIIPLGGFNKISGMDPDDKADPRAYSARPIWARMIVILSGSFMNFFLAIALFFIVILSSGVAVPSDKPVFGEILPDRPAAIAGLAAGDVVLAVNDTKVATWKELVEIIQANANTTVTLEVQKAATGQIEQVAITPEYDSNTNRGVIGVISHFDKYYPGIFESAWLSIQNTGLILVQMLVALKNIILGSAPAELTGPVGIVKLTGQFAQLGFISLLQFAAFLSLNLGLINLFPIPALDGGHFIFLTIEAIRRKPLNRRALEIIHMMGFALLISLMIIVTFKDIKNAL
ncbi:RIP metalloprotease RseP [Selenomonadales bacterium OttesenSCG-928-I06]|nr:RIP metalloprotease RseP [Selenomonadales bacterium OttesenSCG-928-I06]